jgi:hypothetical protein
MSGINVYYLTSPYSTSARLLADYDFFNYLTIFAVPLFKRAVFYCWINKSIEEACFSSDYYYIS